MTAIEWLSFIILATSTCFVHDFAFLVNLVPTQNSLRVGETIQIENHLLLLNDATNYNSSTSTNSSSNSNSISFLFPGFCFPFFTQFISLSSIWIFSITFLSSIHFTNSFPLFVHLFPNFT